MTDTVTAVNADGLDLVLSRLFDAPRALVFRAWTDDRMMSQWWGPHGYTATARLDARTGGRFELTMHGPDGVDYLEQNYQAAALRKRLPAPSGV